jgi:hypothetical protein
VTVKKLTAITQPEVDPLQEDLVSSLQQMLADARAGKLIGVFGSCVYEDDDGEESVTELDAGYSLDVADVILMLRYKVKDLTEDWEAHKALGVEDED